MFGLKRDNIVLRRVIVNDIGGWERSYTDEIMSFETEEKALEIATAIGADCFKIE